MQFSTPLDQGQKSSEIMLLSESYFFHEKGLNYIEIIGPKSLRLIDLLTADFGPFRSYYFCQIGSIPFSQAHNTIYSK